MALMMGPVKVESLKDDLQIGRVLGRRIHYDGTKKDIPTEKLCKIVVCTPATGIGSQNIGGTGVSPVGLREGATILGLWDTDNPELIYAVGGVPTDSGKNGKVQSSGAPGSLALIRSVSPGTTGPHAAPFKAQSPASREVHPKQPQFVTVPGVYTKTFSTKSDSGMFFILHDITGKTFYSVVHPSGTFTEMQSDGSLAQGIIGDMKTSVDGDYTLGVDGSTAMFTNHSMQMRVKEDLIIDARDITINARSIKFEIQSLVQFLDKDFIVSSDGTVQLNSDSKSSLKSKGDVNIGAGGDITIKGEKTDIQGGGALSPYKTFK